MPNTIKTLEWQRRGDEHEWEAPVENGKVVIYRALDKNQSYVAVFVPDLQSDSIGIFSSLDEATEAVNAWVGDSE